MGFSIFINYNGNCREAVAFYADVFGVSMPKILAYGDGPSSPDYKVKDEEKDFVMYTSLNIGGCEVMFSDIPTDMTYVKGGCISPFVSSKNLDEVKNWFNKMKEGGSVEMDLQETFWSKCYGCVVDKFDISWQFSLED